MSSRTRVLSLIALAFVPLILFSAIAIRNNSDTHEARITADRVSLAKAAAQTVAAYVDGNLSTVKALARSPVVGSADSSGIVPQFLIDVLDDHPDWDGIGLIDANGRTLTGGLASSGTVNLSDRRYFQLARDGTPNVSEPIVGRIRGVVTVVLAAPVEFNGGEHGALVVPLSLERLGGVLRDLDGGSGAELIVVDAGARVFVHPKSDVAQQLRSMAGAPEVEAVRRGDIGTQVTRNAEGVEQLVAFAPVDLYGWGVLAYEPTERAFAPVRAAEISQLGLLALAVTLVGAIAWGLGSRLVASYHATLQARAQAELARTVAEQAASRAAAFLASMSQELSGSLDYETTLQRAAQLAVPEIADWCSVYVVDDTGAPRRVAAAYSDPGMLELVQELGTRYSTQANNPVMQVIETGRPTLDPEMEEALRAHGAEDLRPLKVLDGLQLRSAMIVPMIARDHVLGALTFIVTASRHRYAPADLEFAQEAAARIALALDNARLHRDLQQAIRARDDFFAAATHDLRNPLTAILGAAQTLGRRIQPLNAEDHERIAPMLRLVDSAAHRMSRLVSGLADLARMETGMPLELVRAPIDLTALAQRVAAESQQTTDMHEIRVEGPEGIVGSWDASRLERAVANLIDNAIKYSPEGGAIEVRIEPTEPDGVQRAILSVQDPGVGIPAADLPFVFDQFHRGSNVIGQVSGMGLGLAGARQVVEQHGGSISVASELGKGTRMTIELPLTPAATAEKKDEPVSRRA